MPHFSPILFALAFATMVVALTAFGRRLPIPAPLLQVLAGLAVGFVPGVSMPTLDPDVVFFVFLPPILWAAAFFTSFREFTANRRAIGGLAIGLVVATTAVVAVIARMLIPDMPWAVAVALGAIVSPPDAVARCRRRHGGGVAATGTEPCDRDSRRREPRERCVGAGAVSHGGGRRRDRRVQFW
ncbi:cation:proton antiporter [Gemmatimonas sp.]|uniref:cation:proton antiporter domain-containing protein n=1 Tax=Gemmatimonas sp. TaxID=1962908 RepID=UPI003565EC05